MRRNEDMFDIPVRGSGQLISPRPANMMIPKRTLISEEPPIREGQLAAGQMKAIHGAMQGLPILLYLSSLTLILVAPFTDFSNELAMSFRCDGGWLATACD